MIGIAGGSCSGKTTIAKLLARELGSEETAVIGLDSYYHDLSHIPADEIHRHNLDEPAALEQALLLEHVDLLARGAPIDKPAYVHETHERLDRGERIEPKRHIIVEGLFALYWGELRTHLGTGVFIDAAHDLCLERRIKRDRSQRGRTPEEVRRRYVSTVGPMFDLHVLPTRRHADVIVQAADPPEKAVALILQHIRGESR